MLHKWNRNFCSWMLGTTTFLLFYSILLCLTFRPFSFFYMFIIVCVQHIEKYVPCLMIRPARLWASLITDNKGFMLRKATCLFYRSVFRFQVPLQQMQEMLQQTVRANAAQKIPMWQEATIFMSSWGMHICCYSALQSQQTYEIQAHFLICWNTFLSLIWINLFSKLLYHSLDRDKGTGAIVTYVSVIEVSISDWIGIVWQSLQWLKK